MLNGEMRKGDSTWAKGVLEAGGGGLGWGGEREVCSH